MNRAGLHLKPGPVPGWETFSEESGRLLNGVPGLEGDHHVQLSGQYRCFHRGRQPTVKSSAGHGKGLGRRAADLGDEHWFSQRHSGQFRYLSRFSHQVCRRCFSGFYFQGFGIFNGEADALEADQIAANGRHSVYEGSDRIQIPHMHRELVGGLVANDDPLPVLKTVGLIITKSSSYLPAGVPGGDIEMPGLNVLFRDSAGQQ